MRSPYFSIPLSFALFSLLYRFLALNNSLSDAYKASRRSQPNDKKQAFLPGRELSVQMPLHAEAQFIAVVGFFQSPDLSQNTWRLVLSRGELKANAARIIDLRENRLRLRPWRQ
ncbi:type VI secretion lipoprotein TssJ [Rahnella sp. SAP-1]|uniref:Type VI secretion lipoprotein TssJ n=1 Tax=Rouxiella aceris TaxID=2703884 RepID=A0A848MNC0_9GAMM|nr:type VI secretion lipoprotein TssJ [Rouxiella aceris]NMP29275.1 type VI secretion lipoprotein TssJ [Rouxiella aceris]